MNCPNCQHENPDDAKFCSNCGQNLEEQPSSDSLPTALERFIPTELATKLDAVRSSRAMAGERRVVSMLFCDVKGSTAAAEDLDPEDWTEIINGAFEYMIKPVYKYEGTVARLMGDAILAFFGAPFAHEDDPGRAVHAGLDIVQSIRPYREEINKRWGIDFDVRVGINTGRVVVGAVGSDLRMEYTAMGDAINVAARMEQTAEPGTVQIAENTYKLVKPLFEFGEPDEISVKGRAEPVPALRVIAAKVEPGPVRGLEAHGIESPLVGREAELKTAQASIEQLQSRQGGLLGIFGEAGLGKSRLVAELQNALQPNGSTAEITWLEGRTLSFGQTISYWPFQEILREYAGIAEDDSESEAWDKLEEHVSALFAAQTIDILPYLASLFTLEVRGDYIERVKYLDGEAIGRQVFLASRRFFERLAEEQPLILYFDDLHWMDNSSARLLEHLLPLVDRVPILFCIASRPEHDTPGEAFRVLATDQYPSIYTEIVLSPLTGAYSETLVHNLLGIDDLPVRLRESIAKKAEGNPFYVEEIIRTLIDSGAVVRQNGHWQATAEIENIAIPDTLQGVIMARIDRLDEEVKHVLGTAAVIGRAFFYRVLTSVAQVDKTLESHLDRLMQMELIREKQHAPELEYVFKHAIAHEVTYENLLLKRRRELHAHVAQAIEKLFAARLEEFFGLLAYHYSKAEKWEQAQDYLMKAGDQAGGVAADAEALALYRQALQAYERAFGDRWNPFERAVLERKMGEALYRNGDHEQSVRYFESALERLGFPLPSGKGAVRRALLRELITQVGHRLLPVLFLRGESRTPTMEEEELSRIFDSFLWILGYSDEERYAVAALAAFNRAEKMSYGPWIALWAASLALVQDVVFGIGKQGERYMQQAHAAVEASPEPRANAFVLFAMCAHEYFSGRQESAFTWAARASDAFREIGDMHAWAGPMDITTWNHIFHSQFDEARQSARRMREVGEGSGDRQVWAWGIIHEGLIAFSLGQYRKALEKFAKAIPVTKSIPDYPRQALAGAWMARAHLGLGQYFEALKVLDETAPILAESVTNDQHAEFALAQAEIFLALADGEGRDDIYRNTAKAEWLKRAGEASKRAIRFGRSACEEPMNGCGANRNLLGNVGMKV